MTHRNTLGADSADDAPDVKREAAARVVRDAEQTLNDAILAAVKVGLEIEVDGEQMSFSDEPIFEGVKVKIVHVKEY